jgi:hypothetical protein
MLSPYQNRLALIRNKQVPSGNASNKLLGRKISFTKNADALSCQLMLKQAQLVFNAWIRKRDKDKGCVSCKSKKVRHASHYYAAGSYLGLRFCEENAHGSCEQCNTFLSGNLETYRKELRVRIGAKALTMLDAMAAETSGRNIPAASYWKLLQNISRVFLLVSIGAMMEHRCDAPFDLLCPDVLGEQTEL